MSPRQQSASTRCEECKTQKKGTCGTPTASRLCLKRTPDMPLRSQAARGEAKPVTARSASPALRQSSPAPVRAAAAPAAEPTAAPSTADEAAPTSLKVKLRRKVRVRHPSEVVDSTWTVAEGKACAAQFKGFVYNCREFVMLEKGRSSDRTFATAQAAADAFDAEQRAAGCPVVNTVLYDGEIKAVRGEIAHTTLLRVKQRAAATAGAAGGSGDAPMRSPPPPAQPRAPAPPPPRAVPVVHGPAAAAAPAPPPVTRPVLLSPPPAQPPSDLILPASMQPAATKRAADDAALPPRKRARADAAPVAPDSSASRDVSPDASTAALKAGSVKAPAQSAPPVAGGAAAGMSLDMPAPLAADASAGGNELASFLRAITPPLRDLEAAMAVAASDCGLTMADLREALAGASTADRVSTVQMAASILKLTHGGDILKLHMALQRAVPRPEP